MAFKDSAQRAFFFGQKNKPMGQTSLPKMNVPLASPMPIKNLAPSEAPTNNSRFFNLKQKLKAF